MSHHNSSLFGKNPEQQVYNFTFFVKLVSIDPLYANYWMIVGSIDKFRNPIYPELVKFFLHCFNLNFIGQALSTNFGFVSNKSAKVHNIISTNT